MVLEFQSFAFELGVFRLFFGEDAGMRKVGSWSWIGTELKFAHQLRQAVVAVARIFVGIENAAEFGVGEDAFGFDFHIVVARSV